MNDTTITLQGWLGNDVVRRQVGDVTVASFRVASTPRRYSRKTEEWVDGETQWYTVTAWRALADNCARSLRRGDPVVVHGRLSVSTWVNSSGVEVIGFDVDAGFVGHDLARGTTQFTKTARPQEPQPAHGAAPDLPHQPVGSSGEVPATAA